MAGGIPDSGPVMEGVGSAVGAAGAAGAAGGGAAWSAGFCWSGTGVAGAFCARQTEVNPKQRAITARFFAWNFMALPLLWQIAEDILDAVLHASFIDGPPYSSGSIMRF